ncbi:hypothetical protein STRDD10_00308 [Streptococcus sp. DD10]|nr:hypothetical protein STRDD10_00308 [Streptococcus sp. DD10]
MSPVSIFPLYFITFQVFSQVGEKLSYLVTSSSKKFTNVLVKHLNIVIHRLVFAS